jgi:CheY-like chemotaxis protein
MEMAKRILIVDDEPGVIKVVSARLESNGYEVFSTLKGKDVPALIEKHLPDLIVLDIMMPQMSGGEVVRMLKQKESTKNIPVVFLSAAYNDKSPQGNEAQGINVDGQSFPAIGKPFDPDKLLAIIKENLL